MTTGREMRVEPEIPCSISYMEVAIRTMPFLERTRNPDITPDQVEELDVG